MTVENQISVWINFEKNSDFKLKSQIVRNANELGTQVLPVTGLVISNYPNSEKAFLTNTNIRISSPQIFFTFCFVYKL